MVLHLPSIGRCWRSQGAHHSTASAVLHKTKGSWDTPQSQHWEGWGRAVECFRPVWGTWWVNTSQGYLAKPFLKTAKQSSQKEAQHWSAFEFSLPESCLHRSPCHFCCSNLTLCFTFFNSGQDISVYSLDGLTVSILMPAGFLKLNLKLLHYICARFSSEHLALPFISKFEWLVTENVVFLSVLLPV